METTSRVINVHFAIHDTLLSSLQCYRNINYTLTFQMGEMTPVSVFCSEGFWSVAYSTRFTSDVPVFYLENWNAQRSMWVLSCRLTGMACWPSKMKRNINVISFTCARRQRCWHAVCSLGLLCCFDLSTYPSWTIKKHANWLHILRKNVVTLMDQALLIKHSLPHGQNL